MSIGVYRVRFERNCDAFISRALAGKIKIFYSRIASVEKKLQNIDRPDQLYHHEKKNASASGAGTERAENASCKNVPRFE